MLADGLGGDAEGVGDLGAGGARGGEVGDLALAPGEERHGVELGARRGVDGEEEAAALVVGVGGEQAGEVDLGAVHQRGGGAGVGLEAAQDGGELAEAAGRQPGVALGVGGHLELGVGAEDEAQGVGLAPAVVAVVGLDEGLPEGPGGVVVAAQLGGGEPLVVGGAEQAEAADEARAVVEHDPGGVLDVQRRQVVVSGSVDVGG